jgi:hypothetical protein
MKEKKMKGIGMLIIIGLVLWAISRAREAQAAPEKKPEKWELMEKEVPIAQWLKKEIPVFPEKEARAAPQTLPVGLPPTIGPHEYYNLSPEERAQYTMVARSVWKLKGWSEEWQLPIAQWLKK